MNTPATTTVLILDRDPEERRYLAGLLSRIGTHLAVIEAESEYDALEHLMREKIAVFCIGSGYPHAVQLEILSRNSQTVSGRRCAFVVITETNLREEIVSLVNAGASGVILTPIQLRTLEGTIETALSLVRETNTAEVDQVNSLPWILEGIARRLESIASKLNAASSEPTPATSKQMQEALLLAFSGRTDYGLEGSGSKAKELIPPTRH